MFVISQNMTYEEVMKKEKSKEFEFKIESQQ